MSTLRGLFPMLFIPFIGSIEWVEHNGLWYYISDGDMVDYAGAIQKCESMNAHLAVITNDDQNDFIKNAANGSHGRWIGMSNKPTNHSDIRCASNTLLWNSDWYCNNDYSPGDVTYHSLLGCFAVTTLYGMWIVKNCFHKFGYVCQWECKIFHFNISYDNDKYSGIYEFDSYVNGHSAYSKRGSTRTIRMYKHVQEWIIHHDDENPKWIARLSSDSYVPYGTALDWKISSQVFISSTFCIECKTLRMCILPAECYDIYLNAMLPVYTNIKGNVFLKQHHNSLSCICFPTIEECGERCGYIFPYPNVTTRITLDDTDNVTFTNLCILQEQQVKETGVTEIETFTASNAATVASDNNVESGSGLNYNPISQDSNNEVISSSLTTIVVSVVSVAIIILISVVVVIIVYRKRKKRTTESTQNVQSADKSNPAGINRNSNGYIEFDDSIPAQSREPAYIEMIADGHAESLGNTYVDRVNGMYSGDKADAVYEKDKPIGGYLAPNYGILMNNLSTENGRQSIQQTRQEPVYTKVKKTTVKHEGSKNDGPYEKDFQVRKNDGYDSGNEHVFKKSNRSQGEDNNFSNDCEYYNVQRQDHGDDDLELFENTVYDQT